VASKKKKKTAQKNKGAARPAKKAGKPGRAPKAGRGGAVKKGKPLKSQKKKGPKPKPAGKASAKTNAKTKTKGQKPKPGKAQPKAKGSTQKAAKSAASAPRNAKVKFAAPRAPKATIRTPEGAEELKQKLGALSSAVNQIKSLKRTLNKSFYDIGQILREIRDERLYEVKGYGSFEAFVEREIDLGKLMSLRIVQIVQTFIREAALRAGLERSTAALEALEGEEEAEPPQQPGTTATGARSPIPLHKQ
jgi:hypothetical protein